MTAIATIPSDIPSIAITTICAAGLWGGCPWTGRWVPGRYPCSATAASTKSASTATTRPVDLSIPGIGTPLAWLLPATAELGLHSAGEPLRPCPLIEPTSLLARVWAFTLDAKPLTRGATFGDERKIIGTLTGPRIAGVSRHVAGPATTGSRARILRNATVASSRAKAAPRQ